MINIPKDKTAWKCAKRHKPIEFDIVALQLASGRIIPGWWTGHIWDGRRIKEDDVVVAFRSYAGNTFTLKED